jgi:hypothetical protein
MKRNLLISFLFLIAMIIVMRWQGNNLVTPQSTRGIIDLEFAKTTERFHQLQLFWNHEAALQNIYLDFLFIIAYTWFFVTACNAIKNRNSNIFSGLAISAGAFDVLENFLMILIWNEKFNPSLLGMVYYIAAIKFILAVTVLAYLGFSLFGLIKIRSSH